MANFLTILRLSLRFLVLVHQLDRVLGQLCILMVYRKMGLVCCRMELGLGRMLGLVHGMLGLVHGMLGLVHDKLAFVGLVCMVPG